MPTAPTTSPKAAKPRAKAASKPAAATTLEIICFFILLPSFVQTDALENKTAISNKYAAIFS